MLFWLVLHSLQLSGAETAEPGFSGEEVETKLLKQIKSNCDENLRGSFLCQKTGNHWRRRWGDPPGSQKGAWRGPPSWTRQAPSWVPGGPSRCPLLPIRPPEGKNPRRGAAFAIHRRHGAET